MIPSGKDTHIFTGVMDMDTEARYFASGNYRYLLNARTTINTQGSFGALEDVMGNVLVSNPYLFNGRNKVIGSYEDIQGQSCIYFVWNSLGYHSIFRWYLQTNVVEKIYQINITSYVTEKNPLNFKIDYLITGVDLVDDLLYFTDNYNNPRSINIIRSNNTNKKQKWNFYVYQENLKQTVNYKITGGLYFQPPVIILFSDTPNSLYDRCVKITSDINANSGGLLIATNKTYYVEVEVANVGNYHFTVTENSNLIPAYLQLSKMVPSNFYPDVFTTGNAQLTEWYFNNIKSTLQCPVLCEYTTSIVDPQDICYVKMQSYTVSYSNISNPWYVALGFNDDSTPPFNDPYNQFNLGPPIGSFSGSIYSAYLLPNQNEFYNVSGFCNVSINVGSPTETFRIVIEIMEATPNFNITNPIATFQSDLYTGSFVGAFPFDLAFESLKPKYFVRFSVFVTSGVVSNIDLIIISGEIKVFSSAVTSKIDKTTPYIFRAKYIYNNFENSVYSAYSITPTLLTYNENAIKLTFSDKYISDTNYVSQIKNVVLCYSDDNGVTWHDIRMLQPYEFVTQQEYIFFGNESLNTVPESEAAIPFHAVPLLAKSQAYIDERIWYGGMVEGYDLVSINLNLAIDYKDIFTDTSIYPSNFVYQQSFLHSKFGSFWERGYQGYIGIVYADDYDRKTFVNLSPNSFISTKNWSQNINGSIQPYVVPIIDWEINNIAPAWATKYYFVRTPNIRTENFFEWTPLLKWADENKNLTYGSSYVKISQINIPGTQNLIDITINGQSIIPPPSIGPIYVQVDNSNVYSTIVSQINNYSGPYTAFLGTDETGTVVYINALNATSTSLVIGGATTYNISPNSITSAFVVLDYASLATYNESFNSKLEFGFGEGDYLIFNDYPYRENYVRGVVGNLVYLAVEASYPLIGNDIPTRCQIYSPSKNKVKPYFEFGQCYDLYPAFDVNFNLIKYHNGPTQNQTATQPAKGTFAYGAGNVWYRSLIDEDIPNLIKFPEFINSIAQGTLVQRTTMNDYTTVISNNNGRANTISDLGRQDKPTMVRFSDRYIADTEINGNNAFQPLNFKQYNTYYGIINKMQIINNDIIRVVFNNSVQLSIYVNQGILRQGQGAGNLISLSDSVIGDDHLLQRTLGTRNGESVCANDEGDCFGYDENEGVVWLTQSNGLMQISDKGMKSIFSQYSNERKATGGISETPCVYDLYHDEYILTLGNVKGVPMIPPSLVINNIADLGPNYNQVFFDLKLLPNPPGPWMYASNAFYPIIWKLLNSVLVNAGFGYTITHTPNPLGGPDIITITAPNYNDYANKQLQITLGNNVYVYTFTGGQAAVNDIPGSTIAYNKQKQGWTSYYSFVPEFYGRVRNNVVSFKDGQLWRHDINTLAKNFYGTQYTRQLKFVSNKDFPKVKQYKALGVTGIGKNDAPSIFIPPYEGVPTGMLSSLSSRFFQTLEGIQYAHLQKDRLSPGFGGNQLQALVNGRSLKGQTIEITLENTDTSKSSIYSADVVYFYSENS